MNPAQVLDHFDRLCDAPDAIPRLRRFILDLAVRGKLTEHDPGDEPAAELLKRIRMEKARVLKEGGNKKEKLAPAVVEDELPFPLPRNWCWSRLAEIGILNPRNTTADSLSASFVPMPLIPAEYGAPSKHEVRPWEEIKSGYTHFAEGDVALAKITPCFENGKSTIFRGLTGGVGAGTTELHVVRPIIAAGEYILIFLKSPSFIDLGIPRMTGTAGQKRVPVDYFAYTPFPLPSLAEQHRIVAKVDELMALCDQLVAAQVEQESRRDKVIAASLHRLNNRADADEFREHARFHLHHLPRLTTRPEHIQRLRQTILNLAVRGKLVSQDPNDEPPLEFLKMNQVEIPEEQPFQIPESWAWVSVGQIADCRLGKMLDKAKNKGTPRRYLRNVNVRWFHFDLSDVFEMPFEDAELNEFALREGDVLICEGGEPGRAAVWDEREKDIYFQKAIHRVRFSENVDSHFFVNAIRESSDSGRLSKYFTGVGIKHFTGRGLASFVFPLPPIAEQERIVAKVNELMSLCDRLEAQLITTQTERRRMLEAVLQEALNGKILH
jgi:type I restriction enzyme, S subunit